MIWVLVAACSIVSLFAGLRWLRVAQREHYLAPSATRFAWRWWTTGTINRLLLLLGIAGVVLSAWSAWAGLLVVFAQVGPIGLGIRGKTSPLAWTPRLGRLAGVTGTLLGGVFLTGGLFDLPVLVTLGLFGLPLIVDLGLAGLGPVESALGVKWVEKARRKLDAVGSEVVAITGSYGKTTTKNYTAHLLTGSRRVIASPASFNNRMGLARAINENLTPGTEVFVAEMGTYGKGEIAELCEWIPPKVAAMVAIGPVHLERFKTEERIVEAKSEILDRAEIGVICVDHPLLAELAAVRAPSLTVLEVSTGDRGVVRVTDAGVFVEGDRIADPPGEAFAANLAVALGICLALGVDMGEVAERIGHLPTSEHRQTIRHGEGGFSIIDDTFNSNPAGARRGLEVLSVIGAGGKKAVVTPGMVELGSRQGPENEAFAAAAAGLADHLVLVGYTNRRALLRGSEKGPAAVTVVETRDQAVTWVREHLGPGDAVLYENDLPDHYP